MPQAVEQTQALLQGEEELWRSRLEVGWRQLPQLTRQHRRPTLTDGQVGPMPSQMVAREHTGKEVHWKPSEWLPMVYEWRRSGWKTSQFLMLLRG